MPGRKVIAGARGKQGRVFLDSLVNNTELCVTRWTAQEIAEEEEVTNSCSAGYNEYEYGNTYVEGTIEADYDITINPTNQPPVLRAGTAIDQVKMYLNSTAGASPDGLYFSATKIVPNNLTFDVPSKGKITYNFNYRTTGAYSLFLGNVPSE